MKKIISVFMIFAIVSSMLFAGGGKEYESDDHYDQQIEYYEDIKAERSGKHALVYNALQGIANVYDELTAMFCMAMTPFPTMFSKFYETNPPSLIGLSGEEDGDVAYKYPSLRLRSSLLFTNNYYVEDVPTGSQGLPKLTFVRESDGQTIVFTGRDWTAEKKAFNMVTVLFFSFFLLEVLFTAVYGYLTDKDGGVFRDIVSKGVLCILLFLLASALPFLIEAFRVGFIGMAGTMSGIDSMIEHSSGEQRLLYLKLKYAKIFEYPGLLIRSLASVIDMLNPSNIGMTGIDLLEDAEVDGNKIVKGVFKVLISIVYLLIQIFASILILFSALHVMLNVCEVYLLLACTLCLLPFTVFSPLKFLGEKAVMSLFSNLMELFVLIMIMYMTLAVSSSISKNLLGMIQIEATEMAITFKNIHPASENSAIRKLLDGTYGTDFGQLYIAADGSRISKETFDGMEEDAKSEVTLAPITVLIEDTVSDDKINSDNTESSALEAWLNDLAVNDLGLHDHPEYYQAWNEAVVSNMYPGATEADLEYNYNYQGAIDAMNFSSLPIADKLIVLEEISTKLWNNEIIYDMETLSAVTKERMDMSFFAMHIILSILCVLMETYFVNQSSQITNALLSGNVASEGITAAMGKALAGKALGKAAKIGSGAATAPIRAAGAGAGLGMGVMGDKAAASGHTGLASALYMGGGKAAQARHDRQKMVDEAQNGFGSKKNSSSE